MPLISPTSANIRVAPNTAQAAGVAAVAIERFQLIYDLSGIRVAVNDTANQAAVVGIAHTTAEIGDVVRYVANRGQVKSTSALWTPSEFYYLSSTAGKMCTWDELDEGDYLTLLGYAISSTLFQLNIISTGRTKLEPPVNTVAPVVSGSETVGDTLTCTTGTWTGSTPVFTYQWQRGGWSNIVGATASTYLLTGDDEKVDVRCVVTATNSVGTASANSNKVGPIDP